MKITFSLCDHEKKYELKYLYFGSDLPTAGDIIYMKITFSLYEVIFLVFAIDLYLQHFSAFYCP